LKIIQINNNLEGAGVEVVMAYIRRFLNHENIPNAFAVYKDSARNHNGVYKIFCPVNMLENLAGKASRPKSAKGDLEQLFTDPNLTLVKKASINLRKLIPLNDPITHAFSKRALMEFQPDLVHLHKIMPSLAPLNAAAKLGMRVMITLHGYWPLCPLGNLVRGDGSLCDSRDWDDCRRYCSWSTVDVASYMKRMQETLIEKTHLIVPVSDFVGQRMIDFGYPPDMLKTVYNGTESFDVTDTYHRERPFALFCGRMTTHKGLNIFIEAAKLARRRRLDLDFLLVGAGRDAPSIQSIVGEEVEVMPWCDRQELATIMRAALCTVIPSLWHEPLPVVTLESLSCGTPVIGSRVGGIPEMVEDGSNGFLVDVGAKATMAENICDRLQMLLEDSGLRGEMSEKSLSVYKSKFTETIMGGNYLDTYRRLVGE
jgi:glycosyltransferase involved in cell wall biosynthesis